MTREILVGSSLYFFGIPYSSSMGGLIFATVILVAAGIFVRFTPLSTSRHIALSFIALGIFLAVWRLPVVISMIREGMISPVSSPSGSWATKWEVYNSIGSMGFSSSDGKLGSFTNYRGIRYTHYNDHGAWGPKPSNWYSYGCAAVFDISSGNVTNWVLPFQDSMMRDELKLRTPPDSVFPVFPLRPYMDTATPLYEFADPGHAYLDGRFYVTRAVSTHKDSRAFEEIVLLNDTYKKLFRYFPMSCSTVRITSDERDILAVDSAGRWFDVSLIDGSIRAIADTSGFTVFERPSRDMLRDTPISQFYKYYPASLTYAIHDAYK